MTRNEEAEWLLALATTVTLFAEMQKAAEEILERIATSGAITITKATEEIKEKALRHHLEDMNFPLDFINQVGVNGYVYSQIVAICADYLKYRKELGRDGAEVKAKHWMWWNSDFFSSMDQTWNNWIIEEIG